MSETASLSRWHLRLGWGSLLLFVAFGLVLELLHGFKIGWYLDVSNETRRLMWTLAHAHGTLLSLIHVAFGLTVRSMGDAMRQSRVASACLTGTTVLLPGGFFLGGLVVYEGDPGPGVFLVPVGAALLLVAIGLTARAVR